MAAAKVSHISTSQVTPEKVLEGVISAQDVVFSDSGYLGVAAFNRQAIVLTPDLELASVSKGFNIFTRASSYGSRLAFTNADGTIHIFSTRKLDWKEIEVGEDYSYSLLLTHHGILAAGTAVGLFGRTGKRRWGYALPFSDGAVDGRISGKGDVAYLPVKDYEKVGKGAVVILNIPTGAILGTLEFPREVWSTDVCGRYLAIGTDDNVYLYDVSDPLIPRRLWQLLVNPKGHYYNALSVAFSPDCSYIAFADTDHYKVHVVQRETGVPALELELRSAPVSVAWHRDRLAIGTAGGDVYLLRLGGQ